MGRIVRKKPLTIKQQAFVDCYDGDVIESARKAGYSDKGQNGKATLCAAGHRLMSNPEVIKAIRARRELEGGLIASRRERQQFWTRTMEDKSQPMTERLKASELLGKSETDFVGKVQLDATESLFDMIARAGGVEKE